MYYSRTVCTLYLLLRARTSQLSFESLIAEPRWLYQIMGDDSVGLTLNWDIKAILCCGFRFNTLGLRYKIEAYKQTYQPRTLPLGCIVSPISVHLPVGPPWGRHCERLLFTGVCGWFSSRRSGPVSVLDSLFFLSSFLPSVFLCLGTSRALSVCVYSFYFRELFSEDAAHRMHTPSKLSTA